MKSVPLLWITTVAVSLLVVGVAAQSPPRPPQGQTVVQRPPVTTVGTSGSTTPGAIAATGPEASHTLAIHITSPLGRTGTAGFVRIVAQIEARNNSDIGPVRFMVDGQLLRTVESGPPYAVEWNDDNPFEARRIEVEVADREGRVARDQVNLKPFEITEVSGVTSVLLETGVYDKDGQFIKGLNASSFALREDDAPQKIEMVSQEQLPTTFALLIDSSQSMERRFDFVQAAADEIVPYLRPKDRVIVAPFGKGLKAVTGPTNDYKTVAEAINSIRAGGGTSIFDSVVEISGKLEGTEGRKAVVLITDGWDENSKLQLEQATAAANKARATIYVVGIGGVAGISLEGEEALRKLAAETGGRAFFPSRQTEIPLAYDRLAADAQNRYLISYTPSNQRTDGRWRSVALTTQKPGLIVRTRDGYFAPAPPPIRPTLEFTATDLDDHYVDITKDDLEVTEDGVPQKIEAFAEAVSPVSIILALDESGSMKKSAEQVMQAARSFVNSLRPEDSLAILTFSDKVLVAHSLATNRQWSMKSIEEYKAEGGTALYDALYGSLQMLQRVEGRRAVVVLTDGVDEDRSSKHPGSEHTLQDVVAMAKKVDASMFCVGLGRQVDESVLGQVASISGGRAYFPRDVGELGEQYQRIVENLRRRFMLSYTSTNSERNGEWRKVDIHARLQNVHVTSRDGYFAPDK